MREKQIPAREDERSCSVALTRAFEFLGKRWNGILLATLMDGGPAGYAELRRAVTGISDSVLSDRLSQLGAAGLIERVIDGGPPISVTYQLTARGQALLPALQELSAWAEKNLDTSDS